LIFGHIGTEILDIEPETAATMPEWSTWCGFSLATTFAFVATKIYNTL